MKPPYVHEKQHPKHCIEEEVEWKFRSLLRCSVATGIKYFDWVDVQTAIEPKTPSIELDALIEDNMHGKLM